ncbi:MAG: hypothetical protein HY273_14495 [Gammaproteobacteria bacterium]|nr:hypothetical protein [Gammaproteobacteria bacterium]
MSALILMVAWSTAHGETPTPTPAESHHMPSHDAAVMSLEAPGNAVFGAIQEVLRKLEADPSTDWKKVNLEPLRQHLLDMNHMAEHVDVVAQKFIDKGIELTVRATLPSAIPALDRVFNAHPKILKAETGWDMTASKDKDKYKLRVTSDDASQVDKLRALGYIGIMAEGNHHAAHHWALAKGQIPH